LAAATPRWPGDGSEGDAYDAASLAWSPDSKKLAAYRVRPGYQRMVQYVESSPSDQLQPASRGITRSPATPPIAISWLPT
jgi:hypothetical protein